MKIIKFETKSCTKCPIVSQFLDDNSVNYNVIDAEDNPEESSKFGIMGVPVTILLDDNDNELSRVNGFDPSKLTSLIQQL